MEPRSTSQHNTPIRTNHNVTQYPPLDPIIDEFTALRPAYPSSLKGHWQQTFQSERKVAVLRGDRSLSFGQRLLGSLELAYYRLGVWEAAYMFNSLEGFLLNWFTLGIMALSIYSVIKWVVYGMLTLGAK